MKLAMTGLLVVLLGACALGEVAREEVLLETLRVSWAGMGGEEPEVDLALESGELGGVDIAGVESRLRERVVRRVESGEIGSGVAVALLERIAQFGRAWRMYAR